MAVPYPVDYSSLETRRFFFTLRNERIKKVADFLNDLRIPRHRKSTST